MKKLHSTLISSTLALAFFFFPFGGIKGGCQTFQWAKSMGGTNADEGFSIAVDSSGNIYTTGIFQSIADFNPGPGVFNLTSAGNYDIFVSKLDVSGNFLWAKNMGGTGLDVGYSIVVDASGNVYTTGRFQDTADFDPGPGTYNLASAGWEDIFVSKLDSSGNFLWATSMGGTGSDEGRALAVDALGNVNTTGEFGGTIDFDPGAGIYNLTSAGLSDIFVSKLDASGNFLWAVRMGGTSYDLGLSIAVDSSGNVYTTGEFQGTADFDPGPGTFNLTSAGVYDIFVSKLDTSGNFLWAISMGGIDYDFGYSIAVDASGNVYTTGGFVGTADFDPGPGVLNLISAGSQNIFVSKLDGSGNFLWAKSMGGTSALGRAIAVGASGNVYTTGRFYGLVDFDPGVGVSNLSPAGLNDIFVSNFDASGNFLWAKNMGGTSEDEGSSIAVDSSGNIYTTGRFQDTADFDPGAGTYNLTSAGNYDVFVHKMDGQSIGILENKQEISFIVYPNPTSGIFTIEHSANQNLPYEITDITGKVILKGILTGKQTTIDLSENESGVYLLKIYGERNQAIDRQAVRLVRQ